MEQAKDRRRLADRLVAGARFALIAGAAVASAGALGRSVHWPVVTAALGPTAYVFAAHPHSEAARLRNAVVGHAAGLGAGLACLAAFGLWSGPGETEIGYPIWAVVGAASLAVAATLVVLELVGSHHAPAGATSLLVATGLAAPGRPFYGLIAGLATVLLIGPLVGRWLPLGLDAGSRSGKRSDGLAAEEASG